MGEQWTDIQRRWLIELLVRGKPESQLFRTIFSNLRKMRNDDVELHFLPVDHLRLMQGWPASLGKAG